MMGWNPVLGPHPHRVGTGLRDVNDGAGVRDWSATAVRQQIRRPHLHVELRVEHPTTVIVELFRFDQQVTAR